MALTDNLVSCWPQNDVSGNSTDANGSNDMVTVPFPSIGSATGLLGNARSYDGTRFHANVTPDGSLSFTDSFTLTAWVKPSTIFRMGVFQNGFPETEGSAEYALYITSDGRLRGAISPDGNVANVVTVQTAASAVIASEWQRLKLYYDAGSDVFGVQVNDDTPATVSHSGGLFGNGSQYPSIGAISTGQIFNGLIDQVCAWDAMLSSTDDADHYNSGDGLAFEDF